MTLTLLHTILKIKDLPVADESSFTVGDVREMVQVTPGSDCC